VYHHEILPWLPTAQSAKCRSPKATTQVVKGELSKRGLALLRGCRRAKRSTFNFIADLASANSLSPNSITVVVRLLTIPVVLMLMAMLVRDLVIGLIMLISKILM